jgi:hypothetical protein
MREDFWEFQKHLSFQNARGLRRNDGEAYRRSIPCGFHYEFPVRKV